MRSNILMIVAMMVISGCSDAKGGGTTTPSNIKNKVITPEDKKARNTAGAFEAYKPVEINLSDLTFTEAFEIERRAKGGGHTFWWNGEEYTTDLYVDIPMGDYKWVKNADDADDSCKSNEVDECGICDGRGMSTWYIDLDGDGLGDPNIHTESCIYPSVDEE